MRAPSTAPPARSNSVAAFFLLAFGVTWALQLPGVLAQHGLLPGSPEPYMPLVVLGVFGPLIAATVLSAREGGRAAVKKLYGGLAQWRAPLSTYVVALVLPGLLLTALLSLLSLAGRTGPTSYLPGAGQLVAAVLIVFAEEVGWRGYALPRLQKTLGPFAASGLLGLLWTLWHIPMFLGLGIPLSLLLVMLLYFTGGSLVFTWLYNRSRGSLLVVVLAHFGAHLNNSHAALPEDTLPMVVHALVYAALGLALMLPSAGQRRVQLEGCGVMSSGRG